MDRASLIRHIRKAYGAKPEYLWPDSPDACVFRHGDNRKWFAIIMTVERRKLGISGEGSADVVNVKCGPLLSGSYVGKKGVLPAWHMNKTHWLSILLDGTAEDELIRELLEISRSLTGKKK